MRLRTLLTPVLAVGLILSAALLPVSCDNKQAKIVDVEMELGRAYGSDKPDSVVSGYVSNTGDVKLDWISVTVEFCDSDGKLIDEDSDSTDEDLIPGEKWQFVAVITGAHASSYKTKLRYG